MEYYSSTFNTLHKIKDDRKIFGVEAKKIYSFLDYLFLVVDIDLKDFEYSLKAPQNILITSDGKVFRTFITEDKAINELNIINAKIHQDDQLMTIKQANAIGLQEWGIHFKYYFDIKRNDMTAALPFIQQNSSKNEQDKLKAYGKIVIHAIDIAKKKEENKPTVNSLDDIESMTPEISFFNITTDVRDTLINQLKKENFIMNINPKFKARGIVVNPSQCFYVMQFNDDGIQEAHDAIVKKLNDELGIDVIKSGDIFDPHRGNDMVENIWQDIMQSKFIIADLSKRNPNVFYELGICDTVGKTVIPLCSKKSFNEDYQGKFPFDIQQEYTIIYENGFTGISNLQEKVLKRAIAITQGEAINTQK